VWSRCWHSEQSWAQLGVAALLWPAALGVVTARLLPAMSYYGSLAAAAAGVGALIALLVRDRRFGWSVIHPDSAPARQRRLAIVCR
jgi:hypothetical protein